MFTQTYPYSPDVWACDPDNENLVKIFRYVCAILDPLIGDICAQFGYDGYLQTIKSLVIFFADDEQPESIENLIQIFPLLHDAGKAACSEITPASSKFLRAICQQESYLGITPELCSAVFDV